MRMQRILATPGVAWAVVLALASVCAGQDVVEGALGRRLDAHMRACEAFGFSGAVVVVDEGETVLRRGYGLADRASGTPNTSETVYDIASVAKQFTAAAVLLLDREGALSTDDPIGAYLPGVPESMGGITIHHLLTHTAGFPRMGPTGHGPVLADAAAGYLRNVPVRGPGEAFEYHNGGYALLAMIVEKASGMDFRAFCRRRLFEPAGMTSTGFCQDDLDRVAHGYVDGVDIGPATSHSFGWEYRGMGGVVTSAADLERWCASMEELLGEEAMEKLTTAHLDDYAYGWFVRTTDARYSWAPAGLAWHSHGGAVRGFETQLWRFPGRDAMIGVICNAPSQGEAYALAFDLAGLMLVGRTAFAPPPEIAAWEGARLDRIAGTYVLETGGSIVIERVADVFDVHAKGLAAHEALTGASRHDASVGLAMRMIGSLSRGDVEVIAERLAPGIPPTWPGVLRDRIWAAHVEAYGALAEVRPLAAWEDVSGVQIVLELEHERETRQALIVFRDGRLGILDLRVMLKPGLTRYAPSGERELVTYGFMRQSSGPAIEFVPGEEEAGDRLRLGGLEARRAE